MCFVYSANLWYSFLYAARPNMLRMRRPFSTTGALEDTWAFTTDNLVSLTERQWSLMQRTYQRADELKPLGHKSLPHFSPNPILVHNRQITPTASELQDSQSTAPAARPFESRSLSWQRPTTRDKLYDLISYVRKLKINVACISEVKDFNPEREHVSFVFVEEYMFILAESTGILLDPRCRVAFTQWWFNPACRK